jgi:hypothetical protein
MKHVILGAGPAGVIAAETLRKHAPARRDHLVGDEPEAPYSRMAIPYLLMGKVGEEGTTCATRRPLRALRITLQARPGRKVDTQRAGVMLDDGQHCLRPAADRHRLVAGHAAHSRHPRARRAQLLDPGRRARHHGAGQAGARVCRWAPASSAASSWRRWPCAA